MLRPFAEGYRDGSFERVVSGPQVDLTNRFGLDVELSTEFLARVLRAWGAVHGLVTLELGGQLQWSGIDVADLLRREVAQILHDLGHDGEGRVPAAPTRRFDSCQSDSPAI